LPIHWQGCQRNLSQKIATLSITLEQGKRGGKPCIRNLRITVYDVLSWLSQGMKQEDIIEDFPELTAIDINACLAFAADRERHLVTLVS
jgi:uncharacterized protein (DUF433 family)